MQPAPAHSAEKDWRCSPVDVSGLPRDGLLLTTKEG